MTVKLWGVDRLCLRFDYHSESNPGFFLLFVQNVVYFFLYFSISIPISSVLV